MIKMQGNSVIFLVIAVNSLISHACLTLKLTIKHQNTTNE